MSDASAQHPRRPRPRIVANWKMNGTTADLDALSDLDRRAAGRAWDLAICPPATLIAAAAARLAHIAVGAQEVHREPDGAFTGALSASLVRQAGASFAIIGHAESRKRLSLTPDDLRAQVGTATASGLDVLLCVGDDIAVPRHGDPVAQVAADLLACLPADAPPARLAIAYEPLWAIGCAHAAPPATIAAMHRGIRATLSQRWGDGGSVIPILYGGAVDAARIAGILATPHIDGVLVGRASLPVAAFSALVDAALASPAPSPDTELSS